MNSDSLAGTTVRDLVFLVQDRGCQAAAAESQLLASHDTLIKSAARRRPELPHALTVARNAFLEAVRNFRFVGNRSVATYCWSAMCSAVDTAAASASAPSQLPLLVEPMYVPARSADLDLLRRIASLDAVRALQRTQFGLSA